MFVNRILILFQSLYLFHTKSIQTLEKRQGMKISCIEEISYRMKYINKNQLLDLGKDMSNNSYGQYLIKIANSS